MKNYESWFAGLHSGDNSYPWQVELGGDSIYWDRLLLRDDSWPRGIGLELKGDRFALVEAKPHAQGGYDRECR